MTRRILPILALSALVLTMSACQDVPAEPTDEFGLTHVVPAGGSTDVDPNGPISVKFSHPLAAGMEMYLALHEGDLNGPVVSGEWGWSDDGLTLTFTPDEPLKSQTLYTIHIGGGIQDATGRTCNFDAAGQQFGGHWATQGMMGGGTMGGMGRHTGSGWQHSNGFYGLLFTLTTV